MAYVAMAYIVMAVQWPAYIVMGLAEMSAAGAFFVQWSLSNVKKESWKLCIPLVFIIIEVLVVCQALHGFYNDWRKVQTSPTTPLT